MARNHRGFVESLIAANRIGADVLLLNTSFAGPALAEVVAREGAASRWRSSTTRSSPPTVDRALADAPDTIRIVAWTDTDGARSRPSRQLITAHDGAGARNAPTRRAGPSC